MREMSIEAILRADTKGCSLTHNTCSGHAMGELGDGEILPCIKQYSLKRNHCYIKDNEKHFFGLGYKNIYY